MRENGAARRSARASDTRVSSRNAATTGRGVITSSAHSSDIRNRLRRMVDSRGRMSPLDSPTPAIAMNSSRLNTCAWRPREISRVSISDRRISGYSTTISRRTNVATGDASWRQYCAPRVLGTISDTNRISSVATAENTPTHALPNASDAFAPAPTAPAVCAMVLSVRMPASDWSMRS